MRACNVYMFHTELPFCMPPLVVGWGGFWQLLCPGEKKNTSSFANDGGKKWEGSVEGKGSNGLHIIQYGGRGEGGDGGGGKGTVFIRACS